MSARAQRFRRLSRFAAALNAATDPSTLDALVAKSAADVVSADVVILAVHDRASDRFLVRSTHGPHLPQLGSELDAWAPAQRAMESGRIELERIEDRWCAAVPLVRHGRVIGLLLMERVDRPFDPLERETFPLIADQVALAVASRLLGQSETLAAVRDRVTGLFTEEYAAASLSQSLSSRRRIPQAEREAVSVLYLNLDGDESMASADPAARERALSALSPRSCSVDCVPATSYGAPVSASQLSCRVPRATQRPPSPSKSLSSSQKLGRRALPWRPYPAGALRWTTKATSHWPQPKQP